MISSSQSRKPDHRVAKNEVHIYELVLKLTALQLIPVQPATKTIIMMINILYKSATVQYSDVLFIATVITILTRDLTRKPKLSEMS